MSIMRDCEASGGVRADYGVPDDPNGPKYGVPSYLTTFRGELTRTQLRRAQRKAEDLRTRLSWRAHRGVMQGTDFNVSLAVRELEQRLTVASEQRFHDLDQRLQFLEGYLGNYMADWDTAAFDQSWAWDANFQCTPASCGDDAALCERVLSSLNESTEVKILDLVELLAPPGLTLENVEPKVDEDWTDEDRDVVRVHGADVDVSVSSVLGAYGITPEFGQSALEHVAPDTLATELVLNKFRVQRSLSRSSWCQLKTAHPSLLPTVLDALETNLGLLDCACRSNDLVKYGNASEGVIAVERRWEVLAPMPRSADARLVLHGSMITLVPLVMQLMQLLCGPTPDQDGRRKVYGFDKSILNRAGVSKAYHYGLPMDIGNGVFITVIFEAWLEDCMPTRVDQLAGSVGLLHAVRIQALTKDALAAGNWYIPVGWVPGTIYMQTFQRWTVCEFLEWVMVKRMAAFLNSVPPFPPGSCLWYRFVPDMRAIRA